MRAIDDDTEVKAAVLRKFREWGPLPESDVSRMLKQYLPATDDFRDMVEEGLLDMAFAGDEYVLSCTTLGRLSLSSKGIDADAVHRTVVAVEVAIVPRQMADQTQRSSPQAFSSVMPSCSAAFWRSGS